MKDRNRTLVISVLLAGQVTALSAADLDISDVPLFLGEGVEPNVMMTLDDSGSMQWEIMPAQNQYYTNYMFPMPSNLYGGAIYANQVPNYDKDNVHNFFGRSAHNNVLFYDPDITYVPWSKADGSSMGDANPSAAMYNPANPSVGSLNLTSRQTQNACWFKHTSQLNSAYGSPCYGNYSYWPITYYNYTGGSVTSSSSYSRVQITSTTPASATFSSPSGIVRSRDEEIQNFANWFQYYRSRILAARAGIGRAFAQQGTGMRVGFAAINEGSSTIDGVASSSALIKGVREFSGTNRSDFFDALYGRDIDPKGTPLRSALNNVGKYFERDDNSGPWSKVPGSGNSTSHLTCRQSYNILMTDGYWNGPSPSLGNVDNTVGTTITNPDGDTYTYSPDYPYKDDWSNTLADVGMYYWKRDLRSNLDNEVATSSADPAFWQHLVNFTVGLGVDGTLDSAHDLGDLSTGNKVWPQPSADSKENIDDLWHTAVNSRGDYFSAADPDTFADALSSILTSITNRSATASSAAVSVSSLVNGGTVYQASFDSEKWTGDLKAFSVSSTGAVSSINAWSAADQLPAANSRVIVTYDGTDGQPFRWDDLTGSQKGSLINANVLNYIRGDQSNEINNGGSYRTRTSLIGDIVHSDPLYIGEPGSNYSDNWGSGAETSSPYSTFVADNASRQPVVYVGGNDGMLHGFKADSGEELFAYVPDTVIPELSKLTSPTYNHQYYVDGAVAAADVFFNAAWHTVVVGSLRAGGQGIYAIDVTTPSSFSSESSAKTKVLWEFTDTDDSDLGYTFGKPSIARLQNGKWAAVFSGGYNNTEDDDNDGSSTNDSTSGNAVIYIVDIEDGSLIKKFDTKVGMAEDPSGANRPNGLGAPFVADYNNDDIADAIYAGDLFGNIWKLDISASNTGNWDFPYKNGAKPKPIFTACFGTTCTGTNIQPITSQIKVTRHPTTDGYLVLFGTGKYFETTDNSTTAQVTQSVYGIWDKAESSLSSFDRSDLLSQQVIKETTAHDNSVRVTTNNTIDWSTQSGWYLDLVNTEGGNTDNEGERVINDVQVRSNYLIVTSAIPSVDECEPQGRSWAMVLDTASGSRLDYSVFDIDGDSLYTVADLINVGDIDGDGIIDYIPASGVGTGGIIKGTVADGGKDTSIMIKSSTDGTFDSAGFDSEQDCVSVTGSVCDLDPNDGKWRPKDSFRLNDPNNKSRVSWRELDRIFQ